MISREKKLEAIYNFSLMVIKNPLLSYLLGFLAGQIDRVHFVEDLKGANVAVRLCINRSALWPNEPFRATVRGVSIPSPFTFVRTANNDQSQICVMLDFDNADETSWYQEVLLPNASFAKDAVEAANEESAKLKREMDRTLDIYRECKTMMDTSSPERQKKIQFYIGLAEKQLKGLSDQLETLNRKMQQLSES